MKLIVGLGNPGQQYENTRHNAGFMALDVLARNSEPTPLWKEIKQSHAKTFETKIGTHKIILAKPTTYMNLSGQAVASLLGHFRLKAQDLIVVYDDFDLPLGSLRVRSSGSSAGHNGLQSIIDTLKTDEFTRVRIGIGNIDDLDFLNKTIPRQDYVLIPFTKEEQEKLTPVLTRASDAVEIIATHGVDYYLSKHHER